MKLFLRCGTEQEQKEIDVDMDSVFEGAVWYYYSEREPSAEGNYWRYDSDGVTI